MDLEAILRETLAALSGYADADVRRLAQNRRADVVTWRWTAGNSFPHRPEPWFSEKAGREPAWLDEEPGMTGTAVGLDAQDRPVVTEVRWRGIDEVRVDEVWFHGDGWIDVVTRKGPERIVFSEGRVAAKVSGTPDSAELEVWVRDGDGLPLRSNIGGASADHVLSETYVADYDAHRALQTLSRAVETASRSADDVVAAVLAAVEHAAELVPDHVVFDGRTARRAEGLRETDAVIATLGPAVEEAVVAAVRDSQVERPFVVEIRLADEAFPPFVRVGGDEFRRRMTELSPEPNGAVRMLYEAKPPQGATMYLTDYLAEDAMAICRELNWARSYERGPEHPDRRRASAISEQLGQLWARRLNERDWPGTADPFLVLVRLGRQYEDVDAFELARTAVGEQRIAAFRESIAARARSGDLPAAARSDVAALAAELEARGLGDAAARVAAEARQSFRLQPADREAVTRLGGNGLLPQGEEWPHARAERPLTFLAGVDLSELPPTALPPAGWLLFYADLDNDEALGLIEPVANEAGSPARLFYVPPGADPVAAKPPRELRDRLAEQRVAAIPQLTLPDDYELGERLQLDPAEASVVEDAARQLRYPNGWQTEHGDHWILGAVTGVQQHPTEPGTVLLLHIAWDESIGFEYLDGGAIQFRISESALAAGDWSAVTIEPDSG